MLNYYYYSPCPILNRSPFSIQISEYVIKPATKPGDNYASIVFRIKATYVTRGVTKSDAMFILKVEPFLEGLRKDSVGGLFLFDTETKMYSDTLPEMHRLLRAIGDDEIIAPE